MTQIPNKHEGITFTYEGHDAVSLPDWASYYNAIIDYLRHRAELEDQRYKELTPHIDTIAGNRLETRKSGYENRTRPTSMIPLLGSISSTIAVANRNGICTKGYMTFGCACSSCIEEMHEFTDELLLELGKEI